MIKLLDYVIDTQGVIAPEEIINHISLINRDMQSCRLTDKSIRFTKLDSEMKLYKVRENKSYLVDTTLGKQEIQDLYVLENLGRTLYL